jgi:uncharacterized membrane protein
MSLNKSQSFAHAVKTEIPLWLNKGLVDEQSAARLLSLYPTAEGSNKLVSILSIFGSVLVGLGVLLFVSSNWPHMASIQKLATIVLAIVISNLSAWYMRFKDDHAVLGNSLFLLGGLLYGAAIWLIAQTYQLDVDWSLGTSLWSLGLLPMALVTGSIPLVALNNLVLLLWSFSQHNLLLSLTALAVSLFLSYRFNTRTALVFSLLQVSSTFSPISSLLQSSGTQVLFQTLLFNAALYAWYIWHRNRKELFKNCYLALSVLSIYSTVYFLTFANTMEGALITDQWHFYLTLFLSVVSFVIVAKGEPDFAPELVGSLITVMLAFACVYLSSGKDQSLLIKLFANTSLFGGTIALLYSGAKRTHSVFAVNIATVFLALAVLTRYFDTFFGMIDRSLFFLLGGLVLLAGGYLLDQQRRTIIRGIAHD